VKIAFAGKGGSGKTTLSSLFVRHLAARAATARDATYRRWESLPHRNPCLRDHGGGVTVQAGTAARACSAWAGVCPVVHPIQRGTVDLSRLHRLSLVQHEDQVRTTGLHGPFTVAPHPWAGAEI